MNDVQCLSHTKWECKFHIVWIPKCRRKMLYGQLRKNLGDVLHDLARQKESRVLEGTCNPSMCICWSPSCPSMQRLRWWVM